MISAALTRLVAALRDARDAARWRRIAVALAAELREATYQLGRERSDALRCRARAERVEDELRAARARQP